MWEISGAFQPGFFSLVAGYFLSELGTVAFSTVSALVT